jgi:hypothetical protein
MEKITWTHEKVKLGDLRPWENNPRFSTKEEAQKIIKSTKKFGQAETVAIGPKNDVYNGHQRLSAWLTLYGPDYEVDAMRSSRDLTESERREFTIAMHTATGEWDWNQLEQWNPQELKDYGMDAGELQKQVGNASALEAFLQAAEVDSDPETKEPERAEEIRPKQWLRVLISVPMDNVIDAKPLIESLENISGIEVDYGAN